MKRERKTKRLFFIYIKIILFSKIVFYTLFMDILSTFYCLYNSDIGKEEFFRNYFSPLSFKKCLKKNSSNILVLFLLRGGLNPPFFT